MLTNQDPSIPRRIEELNKKLYQRNTPKSAFQVTRKELKGRIAAKTDWSEDLTPPKPARSFPIVPVFVFSALFFLAALAIGGFLLFFDRHIASAAKIDLLLEGPATVSAGEPVAFRVTVTNRNTVPLETADLVIEYPEGTVSTDGTLTPTSRGRERLNIINPGTVINRSFKVILFGEEQSVKSVSVFLEYRLANSNAIFDKKTSKDFKLSAAPIALSLEAPTEINSGQAMTLLVKLVPNTEILAPSTTILIEYPTGFVASRLSPTPLSDKSGWLIDKITPGEQLTFKIEGVIKGEEQDIKIFRAILGSADGTGGFRAVYGSASREIVIRRPFVSLDMRINGRSALEYVAQNQEIIRVDFNLTNNLSTRVDNPELVVKLSGDVLNRQSVSSASGVFRSAEGVIVWNKQTLPALLSLAPGQSLPLSFSFNTLPLVFTGAGNQQVFINPEVVLEMILRGQTSEPGLATVNTEVGAKVKVASQTQIAQTLFQATGPIVNTGPLPPQVDQETTYTVTWTVHNSSSDLHGAVMATILPVYVKWLEVFLPPGEEVEFDSSSGQVIWRLGVVKAGTGNNLPPREMSFKVSIVPSANQVGQSPPITGDLIFTATDSFAQAAINEKRRALTIGDLRDPNQPARAIRVSP